MPTTAPAARALTLPERLHVAQRVARYHATVLARKAAGPFLPRLTVPRAASPSVTLFVTSWDNREPLELTLRSALAHTAYPRLEIVVGDNDSTDGTVELVEAMARKHPVRLIRGPARQQHLWYDHVYATVETDYWVGIHEDLLFLSGDWLGDLVAFMEAHPDVHLLGGQSFPPREGVRENAGGQVVDLQESLSTWNFCVRTRLRDRLDSSFAFHSVRDEERGRTLLWDQGGKLIADVQEAGFGFALMPRWYTRKWYHFENLTWAFQQGMHPPMRAFKLYQLRDIGRRLRALRRRDPIEGAPGAA